MKIHSYDLVEWGKPLQKTERKLRELKNSEVIVEVTASGLCHSDLHFIKGFTKGLSNRYNKSPQLRKNFANESLQAETKYFAISAETPQS